jgi:NAD(P)-dependent dehydrogenase (short-subunit alcohol dehydrogenase family)
MAPRSPSNEVRAAFVTGTRRIGGAIARALGAAGHDVGLVYRTSRDAADAAAAGVRGQGRQAVTLAADLASPAACRQAVDAAAEALGGLSVVVLAASRFERLALDDIDAPAWGRALAVDLDASFHCAHAAVPHLRRAGGGHILLFSDWVAASGRPRYRGYVPYYVAKRGVIALGEALALELAADGIRVHVVAPGPIIPADGTTEAEAAAVLAATPLGRWGGEAEVARHVVALVASTFVTGETLRVDGGRHLR